MTRSPLKVEDKQKIIRIMKGLKEAMHLKPTDPRFSTFMQQRNADDVWEQQVRWRAEEALRQNPSDAFSRATVDAFAEIEALKSVFDATQSRLETCTAYLNRFTGSACRLAGRACGKAYIADVRARSCYKSIQRVLRARQSPLPYPVHVLQQARAAGGQLHKRIVDSAAIMRP